MYVCTRTYISAPIPAIAIQSPPMDRLSRWGPTSKLKLHTRAVSHLIAIVQRQPAVSNALLTCTLTSRPAPRIPLDIDIIDVGPPPASGIRPGKYAHATEGSRASAAFSAAVRAVRAVSADDHSNHRSFARARPPPPPRSWPSFKRALPYSTVCRIIQPQLLRWGLLSFLPPVYNKMAIYGKTRPTKGEKCLKSNGRELRCGRGLANQFNDQLGEEDRAFFFRP
ncbi:hypothetical protein FN846DRAFT_178429 [Sphaerosporella brunnea]|uniref:Uncharacterized protein n=1 Tax=Sphaerosporella brunnea TaxID=1250544 RepID=A0A5J5F7R8_9PEZI|nr:hypothetical protein FN846DRAFT_178429 [Sphaerosporella brunnea]